MSKFLTGKDLNEKIYRIIWDAEKLLLIISPFIKLDDHFKKLFENHKYRHKLHILIVFGKNEGTPGKSLRKEDIDFFKQFRNISIVYCANLHAKYYANETSGVVTSINLYDKSFETNVEYGISYEMPLLKVNTSADDYAFKYSYDLADKSPAVFIKRPVYEKGILGSILGQKNYIDSEVLLDYTGTLFNNWSKWEKEQKKYLTEFPEEINANDRNKEMPQKHEVQEEKKEQKMKTVGYCIRTGVEIDFNPSRPFSLAAYQSWAQYQNWDFPEKYCHKTGKPSNGKTSMRNPILN